MPDQPGTRYTVATDPEATSTTVSVSSMMAARDQTTVGAYRQQMVERVFSGMLSARFDEIAQKPDAPFLDADTNRGLFVRTAEATTLSALVADGGVERGLAALFTEADRVARFGFTQTELDRYRLSFMQAFAQLAASNDEHTSQSLADEFIRNFMQQEPIPGIAYENGLVQRFLPEITLAEVNSLARDWVPDRNRVVAVSAPEEGRASRCPTRRSWRRSSRAPAAATLTAYVDTVSTTPLLETAAEARHRREDRDEGARGSPSGSCRTACGSCSSRRRSSRTRSCSARSAPAARRSPAMRTTSPPKPPTRSCREGGLGTLSAIDLSKKLAGKTAVVRPDIDEMDEGLSGRALRRDLETMFQLIYLTFTQPRADPEAFRAATGQLTRGAGQPAGAARRRVRRRAQRGGHARTTCARGR